MSTTGIEVGGDPERPRCSLGRGLLVPRQLPSEHGTVRVALVASTALLLAGDEVRVDVHVGDGLSLEVVETAGTVAYAMRGGSARWDVTATLGRDASLVWVGLPFVVADGADVDRSTQLHLADGATAVLRESMVLGRSGQAGGRLESRTRAWAGGRPVLSETLLIDARTRDDPVVLAGARCLDTVTALGLRLPDGPGVLQLDGAGSIARRLVDQLHESDLDAVLETGRQLSADAPRSATKRSTCSSGIGLPNR